MKHIGPIIIACLSFSFITFGQVEKKVPTVLEQLQSRGLDPRVSNIRPEKPAVVPLSTQPERDVPTGTLPKSVRLKTQQVTVAPNKRIHPNSTTTQSEMSIHTHPTNPDIVIAGSNAAENSISVLSQGWYYTTNGGATWLGRDTLPTHTILSTYLSDPAVGIDLDGRLYFNALNLGAPSPDVFVSRSTNDGTSWTQAFVNNPGTQEDKGHFTADVNPGSPYENYLYTAFTDFGFTPGPIALSRSTDNGQNFSTPVAISGGVGSYFAQGINLAVGPESELYAVWSGYDAFPTTSTKVGFNVSTNGGATWGTARAVDTVHEIRGTLTKGGNSIRVSSFPSMAVDRSNGPRRGWIYVVYPEKVTSTPDIMMIRSTNGGVSWSSAIKVNQDGGVNDQWYPWVTVDPTTGGLYVVYYDSRNFSANDSAQVYISNSLDGGDSFEDVLVSDMPFLPAPIPGLAGGYMGDYIGIAALNGIVWPCWNDNRTGRHQAYTSRIQFLSVGSSATISVSPDSLDFGTFFVGLSDTMKLSVRNLGYPDTLFISDIRSDSASFTPGDSSLIIPGGNSRSISIFFSPADTGLYTGNLLLTSNDSIHPVLSVPMRGNVVFPPVVGISPDSIPFSVNEGDSAFATMTVHNTGLGEMQFIIKHTILPPSPSQFPQAVGPATTPEIRTTDPYASLTVKDLAAEIFGRGRGIDGSLAIEPDAGRLFAAGGDKVSEINPVSGAVIRSFNLPVSASNSPTALAWSGSEIFFADAFVTPNIYVLEPDSGHVLRSFAAPSTSIDGLAYVDGHLYVQDYSLSKIYELNPVTGAVLRTLSPPVTIGGGLDGGNGRLFASNFSTAIYELSLANGSVIRTFTPVSNVYGLGFTGQHLYASIPGVGIDQYDPNTGSYLGRISTAGYAALAGGGSDWLSAVPLAGTVPPNDSVHVQVKVRSDELDGGTFHAKLTINSNDPVTPELSIPVQLTVIGAPNLALDRDTIDFDNAFVNYPDTLKLMVSNNGSDTLRVTGMSNTNARYTILGPSIFNLAPSRKQPVLLRFLPLSEGVETGLLSITSNDASDPAVTAVLTGNGLLPPIIDISPDSVIQSLFSGDSARQTLTVSNTGFSDLNFSLSMTTIPSPGALPANSVRPPLQGQRPDLSHFATDITAGDLAATGSVRGAPGLAGKATMSTAATDILVLTTAPITGSVLRALDSLGKAYDLVSTQVFTGIDYSPYRTIIVAMDGGSIEVPSVQALAAARAAGKTLIMIGGTNYIPYYQGLQTYLLSHNGLQGWTTSTTPHLTVTDPSHGLASGLPATHNFATLGATAYMLRINDSDAPVAAKNGDNYPILINKGSGGGGLVYFTNTPYSSNWSNPADFAIFRTILSNAIDFDNWIGATPRSATVPAGSSIDVDVRFDAAGLNGGEYRANIVIASNDPATPNVLAPAHLHVTGAPNIVISKDSISYGDAYVGFPKSDSLKITNTGTDVLNVTGIASDNPRFVANPGSVSVNPGSSRMVHVALTPIDTGGVTGMLTIMSNDPTDSTNYVALAGHGIYPPVIVATPDSLGFTLDEGDSTTAQLTIANHGLGELRWSGTTSSSRTAMATMHTLPERTVTLSRPPNEAGGTGNTFKKDQPRVQNVSQTIASVTGLLVDLTGKHIGFTNSGSYQSVISDLVLRGATVVNISFPLAPGVLDTLDVLSVDDAMDGASGSDITLIRNWLMSGKGLVTQGDQALIAIDTLLAGTGITEFPASFGGDMVFTNIIPHPTTDGVDSINGASVLAYSTVVAPAQAIVFDGLARPNISVSSLGTGRVLASGNEVMEDFSLGVGDTRLFSNQVFDWLSAATDFVKLNPTLGTVNAGDSQHVDVKISTRTLDGGTYHAYIHFQNNDPGRPDLLVPVDTRVIGKPDIALGTDTIDFGNVYIGYPDTMTLRIDNKGSDTLHVSNMVSSESLFTVIDTLPFTINRNGHRLVRLQHSPDAPVLRTGVLTISSDDPDHPSEVVELMGTGIHPGVIGVTPDSLGFSLLEGDSASANLNIANTGLGALSFRIHISGYQSAMAPPKPLSSAANPSSQFISEMQEGTDGIRGTNRNSSPNSADRVNSSTQTQHIYTGTQMKIGISDFGEIMPFEYPFGSEHLQIGGYVSGYTLVYFDGGSDKVAYAIFDSQNGFSQVSYNEIENSPTRTVVEVVVRTTDNRMELLRRIVFEKSGKSVGITETIKNISSTPMTNVVLKEDADWDVDGDFNDDYWNYDSTHNMIYAYENHYVAIAGPHNPDFATSSGWGSHATRQTTNDRNPHSLFDGMEVLHYEMGDLAPGEDRELQLAYAGGNSLADLQLSVERVLTQTGGWITVAPDTGSVAPGGNTNVQVKIKTHNLDGGTFHASIQIKNSDPAHNPVIVPVELRVIGSPDIALSKDSLKFGDVFINNPDTLTFVVTNNGSDTLHVSGMTPGNPKFSVVGTSVFNLAQHASRPVKVRFYPTVAGPESGPLTITSDDPQDSSIAIELTGNGIYPPVIAITPDSLALEVNEGDSLTSNLTIRNTGLGALNFDILIRGYSTGIAPLPPLNPSGEGGVLNRKARIDEAVNAMISRSGILQNQITGENAAQSGSGNGTPAKSEVLTEPAQIAQTRYATSTSAIAAVAVLGSPATSTWNVDVQGKLLSTGLFSSVSIINIGSVTPTLSELQAFDAVLVYSDAGYQNSVLLGNVLADYVDAGGGVVCAVFSVASQPIGGRFDTGGYWVIPPSGQTNGARAFLGTIYDASHPILSGVTGFDGGSASFRQTSTAIASGATRIADWTDGKALVATKVINGTNRADLGFFPPSSDVRSDFWYAATDGKLLMANALWWVAGGASWLTASPSGGVVAAGDSQNIGLKINTDDLDGGTVTAYLHVGNNDPVHPDVVVPVRLRVFGRPDISLSTDSLDFGDVFINHADTLVLVISNNGSDTLHVSGITPGNPKFTVVGPSAFSIPKNASRPVSVRFSTTIAGPESGPLTITSDDPGDSLLIVQLLGNGVYPPVASVTPDSLAFTVYWGDSATATLTLSNTGLGALNYSIKNEATSAPGANEPMSSGNGQDAIFTGKNPIDMNNSITSSSDVYSILKLNSLAAAPTGEAPMARNHTAAAKNGKMSLESVILLREKFGTAGRPIKAAVLDSYGADYEAITWDALNANWGSYGSSEIVVDYVSLNKEGITYTDLVNTNADVLLLSDAWAAFSGWDFTNAEWSAIKQYVNEGHGLIATSGSLNSDDAPNNTGNLKVLLGIDTVSLYDWGTFGPAVNFVNPGHPLLRNISAPYQSGDPYTTVPKPSNSWKHVSNLSSLVAMSSDSIAALLAYQNRVYISNIPEAEPNQQDFQLLYNAIVWAGGNTSWLTENPVSGAVPPGQSIPIAVKVKPDRDISGTYRANIRISNNDPDHPVLTVPVTLTLIVPSPILRVSPETLMTNIVFGDSANFSLMVYNDGDGPLHLTASDHPTGGTIVGSPTTSSLSRALMRGNIYKVYNTSTLEQFKTYCQIPSPTPMQFAVYESNKLAGPYHRLSSVIVSLPAGSASFRSSGPLNVSLRKGKYYYFGSASFDYATYYRSSPSLPVHFPSGDAVSSGTWNYDEGHTEIAPAISPAIWYQSVTISGTFARSIVPQNVTIPAGSNQELLVRTGGHLPFGKFGGEIVLTSNDSARPELHVPMNINVSLQLSASTGWNIFSIPINAEENRKEVLFPTAGSAAFSHSGHYSQAESLKFGVGYWLKYETDQVVSFSGKGTGENIVPVHREWNLIGPPSYLVTWANVQSVPPGNLLTHFVNYSSAWGYYETDSLLPGIGSWFRAKGTGELIFNEVLGPASDPVPATAQLAPVRKNSADDAYNTVSFTDNARRVRTLYFSSSPSNGKNGWMELPPPAPASEFDVRFTSQRLVEERDPAKEKQEFLIGLTGAAYPIKVEWTIHGDEADHALAISYEDGTFQLLSMKKTGHALIAEQDILGMKLIIGGESADQLPKRFAMYQNYPNPFNPSTRFRFDLPVDSRVGLYIYNTLGQEVARLIDGVDYAAGTQTVIWNGAGRDAQSLPSGVYFYRLNAAPYGGQFEPFAKTGKMLLMK